MNGSKLISENKFWEIIEKSEEGTILGELLDTLSDDELIGFAYWWDYYVNKLYRQDIWAVAYVVRGGCSDDSFEYFRYWLMTQGHETVKAALENADSLCNVFERIESLDDPLNEEVNNTVFEAIENRDSENPEFSEKYNECEMPSFTGEIEFEWEEDDDESIRAICPRTFDRFGDNPPYLHLPVQPSYPSSDGKKGFIAKLISLFTGRK